MELDHVLSIIGICALAVAWYAGRHLADENCRLREELDRRDRDGVS